MKVILVEPCGFCPGVSRALTRVENYLETHRDQPVYLSHPIVHNQAIGERLKARWPSLSDYGGQALKAGETIVFSAHGRDLDADLPGEGYEELDCLCPVLKKRFDSIEKHLATGLTPLYLGKPNHPESRATVSLIRRHRPGFSAVYSSVGDLVAAASARREPLLVAVQSTLMVDVAALEEALPAAVVIPPCRFSSDRWQKIQQLPEARTIVVVGSFESSNTCELRRAAARNEKARVFQIERLEQLRKLEKELVEPVAVASGTSTDAADVAAIVEYLKALS